MEQRARLWGDVDSSDAAARLRRNTEESASERASARGAQDTDHGVSGRSLDFRWDHEDLQ